MDINMENITYQVECIASSGKVYDLSPVLIGLQWEEQTNELAQRLTVSVANMAMDGIQFSAHGIGGDWLPHERLCKLG